MAVFLLRGRPRRFSLKLTRVGHNLGRAVNICARNP